MKKVVLRAGIGVGLVAVGILSGCAEQKITYEGKLRPISEVQEIISDKLEVENPNLDLEVNIQKEVD